MTTESTPSLATEKPPPFQFRVIHLLVATALIGIAISLAIQSFRAIENAREAARASTCNGHMHQLRLALLNYHDAWNCFPPVRYDDAAGRPMHSWRMLISPYLESRGFFNQYDFSEPWNGPNNSKLSGPWEMFVCPSDKQSSAGTTNYVAVTGAGTAWPLAQPISLSDMSDGPSETILIVEISNSDIHWMEPRDLPIEELEAWLDPAHKPRLFGNHIQGSFVAHADGSVVMLPRDVTIERLRAMITPAGKD